jgi:hypothetical protein
LSEWANQNKVKRNILFSPRAHLGLDLRYAWIFICRNIKKSLQSCSIGTRGCVGARLRGGIEDDHANHTV